MRGTYNSLQEFKIVCCIFGQMRPFTHFILKRSGLPLSRYPGGFSTSMLLGDWCNHWPKVFVIYPTVPPDAGLWFSRKVKQQFPCPLPQLPTYIGSSIGKKGIGVPEEADLLFSLQRLRQLWNYDWGFPQVSHASPNALTLFEGRLGENRSHRILANLVSQGFCIDLLCL